METQEIKEVEPRNKVLFINMGPTSEVPSFQIASRMFGNEGQDIEKFSEMMLARINSPKLLKGEKSGSFRQVKESSLLLPRIDEVSAVVITGSSFSAALLKRDLRKLGVDREGKGIFLPEWQKELADFIKEAYRKKKPMLGVCFGAQMIAEALGGKVEQIGKGFKEVGYAQIYRVLGNSDPLLAGIPEEFIGIANHDREIVKVPDGATVLAKSKFGIQAFRTGKVWGLQFHPEKTAKNADDLLANDENKSRFDPKEQEKLRAMFDQETGKKILTNFMKTAWSGLQ